MKHRVEFRFVGVGKGESLENALAQTSELRESLGPLGVRDRSYLSKASGEAPFTTPPVLSLVFEFDELTQEAGGLIAELFVLCERACVMTEVYGWLDRERMQPVRLALTLAIWHWTDH